MSKTFDEFSGFFEDETTPENDNQKEKDAFFEEDFFVPPPDDLEDEEPLREDIPSPAVKESEEERSFDSLPPVTPVDYPDEVQRKPEKKKKPGKEKKKGSGGHTLRNWIITVFWVLAVLAVSVTIAIFALRSINDLVGFRKDDREIEVFIPENASLGDIADILKDKGVIDEPFAFEVYARIKKKADKFGSGNFSLNSNLGYDQLFIKMKKVVEQEPNTVTITFPEGMTVSQIARKLEENNVCSYDDFMKAVDTEEFDYDFVSQMGDSENIYHKWEGYVFPDTYEFFYESSPRTVLVKFIDNFSNKMSDQLYQRMNEMGMTLHETITLASVIQSEAAKKDDMLMVSSAFHNRLKPGSGFGMLQSDVTYFYYRDEIEPYTKDDKATDERYYNAYDTYVKKGYPVGPICCPGMDAIEAALYPADTNYYYFVTDVQGNFYYAATLEEHEANIIKAGRG